MKKSIAKAITLGMSGVTALNSVPVNVIAMESKEESNENKGIDLSVKEINTNLSTKGKDYYSESSNKVIYNESEEATLRVDNLKVSEDEVDSSMGVSSKITKVELIKDGNSIKEMDMSEGSMTFNIRDLVGGTSNIKYTVLNTEGVEEVVNVSLSDYLITKYPSNTGIVLSNFSGGIDGTMELGNEDGSSKPITVDDWNKGGVVRYLLSFDITEGLSADDYNIDAKVNKKDVIDTWVTKSINGGKMNVVITVPLDSELLELNDFEGVSDVNVVVTEVTGKTKSYTSSINVDNKAPNVKIAYSGNMLVGLDGKTYLDGSSDKLVLTAKDGGHSVSVLDEILVNDTVVASGEEVTNGGTYDLGVLKDLGSEYKLSVKVKDKLGNERTLSLADMSDGTMTDTLVFGMKDTVLNAELSGYAGQSNGWYRGESVVLNVSSSNSMGIDKVLYNINGETVEEDVNSSVYSKTLDIANKVNKQGVADVSITVRDKSGSEKSISGTYKIDNSAPEIDKKSVLDDESKKALKVIDGVAYSPKELNFSLTANDMLSGVDKVEIYKNGVLEETGNSFKLTSENDNASYSVKVYDKAGNSVEYSLSELLGLEFSKIVVNDSVGTIDIADFEEDFVIVDGNKWYQDVNKFSFDINSEYIKEVTVSLDNDYIYKNSSAGTHTVSLSDLDDGKHTIKVKLETLSGLVKEETVVFNTDKSNPSIDKDKFLSDKDKEVIEVTGDTAYTSKPLTFTVNGKDTMSGVDFIEVYKNGTLVKTERGNFTYALTSENDNAAYTFKVYDKVGNVSEYALDDILGLEFTNIIVDDKPGVIDIKPFEEKCTEIDGMKWYQSVSKLNFSINNKYTRSVEVELDGKVILNDSSKAEDYEVALNNISDGKHEIVITMVTMSGLKRIEGFEFSVDSAKPEINKDSFISEKDKNALKVVNGVVYSPKSLKLSLNGSDKLSGYSHIEVYRGTTLVSDESGKFEYTISPENDDEMYSFKVYDMVGNMSEYTMSEILGTDFSKVVIADDAGSITIKPFEEKSVELDGVTWYKSVGKFSFSIDSKYLKDFQVYLDKDEIYNGTVGGDHEVALSNISDGSHTIKVVSNTLSGLSKEASVSFSIDSTKPLIEGAKLSGEYEERETGVYFKEIPSLSVSSSDKRGIGVETYKLFKDGTLVESNETGKFKISDNGIYTLSVVDKLGNESDLGSLKDLAKLGHDYIVVDSKAPSIDFKLPAGGIGEDENIYGNNVSTNVTFEDENGILEASVIVNGSEVYKFDSSVDGYNKKVMFNLDTEKVNSRDGNYSIEIRVTDNAGNTSSEKSQLYVDMVAPELTDFNLDGKYVDGDGFLWFDEEPKVKAKGEDNLADVKEFYILNKDGSKQTSDKGNFTLKDGDYAIVLVDTLGNTSKPYSFKDLLGTDNETIAVDNINPVINTSRPEGDLDGWYNRDVDIVANLSDNRGIKEASISMNGKVVSTEVENGVIKANTSEAEFEVLDNKCSIVITAKDYFGNTSSWGDTIYIDKDAPGVSTAQLNKEYNDLKYGVFFKEKPNLLLEYVDSGIGIDSYILCDESGKELDRNENGVFSLETGEYFIRVEDKLGNSSDMISLKDLLGLKSNLFVVDSDSAVITASRPSGDVNGWYANDVKYAIGVTDNIGIQKATVSINGEVVDEFEADKFGVLNVDLVANTSIVKANEDGSYRVEVIVTDNSGNTSSWNDTIFIDRVSPNVTRFVVNGQGYKEGAEINGTDEYGFFLNGASSVDVYVSDANPSSGMDYISYELVGSNCSVTTGKANIVGGVATINIPSNFKGFISAYAVDKVGNVGYENRPDGIVSEDSNVHVNTSSIKINLPDTVYRDASGNLLYNSNITANAEVSDKTSGIRKLEWGIGEETLGVVDIDNKGSISGDTAKVVSKDKNLVIDLSKDLPIDRNVNSIDIWVKTTDRVGHESYSNRVVSIDKDAPVINVTYDSNINSGYYASNRTARVVINERNFNSSNVKFTGNVGSVGSWSREGDNWVTTVTFSEDNEYQWGIEYTDMAGNTASPYSSEKFTIDKTSPKLDVTFDNNDVSNGNFYKNGRIATVRIVEKNFNPDLVKLEGSGSLSNWSSDGDVHTARINFSEDGEYEFSVSMADLAGNSTNSFSSGKFIIDKAKPNLEVVGVQNGVSYKKNANFIVRMNDDFIDTERSTVALSSRSNGDIKLTGGINGTAGEYTFNGVSEDERFDDLYNLKATIYDKAGNVSEENISFSINRYGSKYKFSNKDLLGAILNSPEGIFVEEVSVDRLDMSKAKVVVIRDGEEIFVDDKYINIEESGGTDSNWVYKYNIDKAVFDKDGKYQIQIYSVAMDGTDNSSLSQEYSFILDTTDPEIIISGIKSGETYNDVSRKVVIDVRDLTGVDKIEAKLNGKKVDVSAEEDGMYSIEVDESKEEQNLVVKVTDKAGNKGTAEVENFLVTTDTFQILLNKTWFKVILGGVGAFLAALIALLFARSRKAKKEELEMAQEHAQLYKDSTEGSSTNSSNSNNDTK